MIFLTGLERIVSKLPGSLNNKDIIPLIPGSPHKDCRVCVIVPVCNEARNLPKTIRALAGQVDGSGQAVDPNCYEVLIFANNCRDDSAAIARSLGKTYPKLNLIVVEATLYRPIAHVGAARRLIMNEAYRRLAAIGLNRRIIASTDGDTEVFPNWISALINEFDKGVEAVGGRIFTHRTLDSGLSPSASLYFLRRLAHQYHAAQIEAFLDPQPHDCWPRHFQYCGANMAVLAKTYGQVGGLPLVRDEEDVALYRRLQQVDAKIRHSLDVQVLTSARQVGRATSGLAELLDRLTQSSQQQQAVLVEPPALTEARILVKNQLRQVWQAVNAEDTTGDSDGFVVREYAQRTGLLSQCLKLPAAQLRETIEGAATFGQLVEAIERQQQEDVRGEVQANTEISLANMHLRHRVQTLRQQTKTFSRLTSESLNQCYLQGVLQALKQVQSIPLFSLRD
ncbi:MAG: glycosyltransferase [Phormidesmis sp.]